MGLATLEHVYEDYRMIFIPKIRLVGLMHNNWYDIMPGDICLVIDLRPGYPNWAECLILHPQYGVLSSAVSEDYGQLLGEYNTIN